MNDTVMPNEAKPELLGMMALNPFIGTTSMGRVQMIGSHLGQKLNVSGASERLIKSGVEGDIADYTFSIKMPVDGLVIAVIDRYRKTVDRHSVNENPETVVIYEDQNTKEVGCFRVVKYCSNHQYFGFEYKPRPVLNNLSVGSMIPAGTVIMDSPSVVYDDESGEKGYAYGVNLIASPMAFASNSEDGFTISESAAKKFSWKTYKRRVAEWSSEKYPLNAYGTLDEFKAFPDIGECIRKDGVLMAFRSYNKALAPVQQSSRDLMKFDYIFDTFVYANGAGEGGSDGDHFTTGRVIDIRITHNSTQYSPTPMGMDGQAIKYDKQTKRFYQEILAVYNRIKKYRGEYLSITEDFSALVVDALRHAHTDVDSSYRKNKENKPIHLTYKRNPVGDYRIEFIIEYEHSVNIGNKLTGMHGDKGVVCRIVPDHDMPFDPQTGLRAEITYDPGSIIHRQHPGRAYEVFINAASRNLVYELRDLLDIQASERRASAIVSRIHHTDAKLFNRAYSRLMRYYQILNPLMYEAFNDELTEAEKAWHLGVVLQEGVKIDGIHVWLPTDNAPTWKQILSAIKNEFAPPINPVEFVGVAGHKRKTKLPVVMGSAYFILLEKVADTGAAVSSGKLNHHGTLATISRSDKYGQPVRAQPSKVSGEAEVRNLAAHTCPMVVAEQCDRSTSPITQREVVRKIMESTNPTAIDTLIDRELFPYDGSSPLKLVHHISSCAGWKFTVGPVLPPNVSR